MPKRHIYLKIILERHALPSFIPQSSAPHHHPSIITIHHHHHSFPHHSFSFHNQSYAPHRPSNMPGSCPLRCSSCLRSINQKDIYIRTILIPPSFHNLMIVPHRPSSMHGSCPPRCSSCLRSVFGCLSLRMMTRRTSCG